MERKWNFRASLVAETVKNPPVMHETQVFSLSWENPRRGNGYPLQHSCLENSMDRGAWRARVYRVAKSWTQWKQLSRRKPDSPREGPERACWLDGRIWSWSSWARRLLKWTGWSLKPP